MVWVILTLKRLYRWKLLLRKNSKNNVWENLSEYFLGVINDKFYYKILDNMFESTYLKAIKHVKKKGYDITIKN